MNKKHAARVYRDIIQRSYSGLVIYPVFWFLIGFFSPFYAKHPVGFWLLEAVFIVITSARFYGAKRTLSENEKLTSTTITLVHASILLSPIFWGAIYAYSLSFDGSLFAVLMTVSVAGIVAGAATSYAPIINISRVFTSLMLLPAALSPFFLEVHWLIGLMCLTYLLYTFRLSGLQYKEYWTAIENEDRLIEQNKQMEMLSQTDVLTNLSNRRFFNARFEEYWNVCKRAHAEVSLLLIDVDHFKRINDQYGHLSGDAALVEVGKVLQGVMHRTSDVIARVGGEEFAILLPFTGETGAVSIATKILNGIAQQEIITEQARFSFTVSIGIASTVPHNNLSAERLYSIADSALYKAKENGRNQLQIEVINDAEHREGS